MEATHWSSFKCISGASFCKYGDSSEFLELYGEIEASEDELFHDDEDDSFLAFSFLYRASFCLYFSLFATFALLLEDEDEEDELESLLQELDSDDEDL